MIWTVCWSGYDWSAQYLSDSYKVIISREFSERCGLLFSHGWWKKVQSCVWNVKVPGYLVVEVAHHTLKSVPKGKPYSLLISSVFETCVSFSCALFFWNSVPVKPKTSQTHYRECLEHREGLRKPLDYKSDIWRFRNIFIFRTRFEFTLQMDREEGGTTQKRFRSCCKAVAKKKREAALSFFIFQIIWVSEKSACLISRISNNTFFRWTFWKEEGRNFKF